MSEETNNEVSHNLNKVVSAYLKLRDTIEQKEEQHKAEMQELKEEFEAIGSILLDHCNERNIDGFRSPVGTVSRRISTRYWTSDWDSMYQFIKQHDAPFLLEQRIHTSNMREFLENNPDVLPVGLQAERKFTVQVRKPTKK